MFLHGKYGVCVPWGHVPSRPYPYGETWLLENVRYQLGFKTLCDGDWKSGLGVLYMYPQLFRHVIEVRVVDASTAVLEPPADMPPKRA